MENRRGPRERIVLSAVRHLRVHGADGMALRAVVADAEAPWGSFAHYFPGGKDQLLTEAIEWSGRYAVRQVGDYLARARRPDPSGLADAVVQWWITDLERGGVAAGCPVAGAVADGHHAGRVGAACRVALTDWQDAVRLALRDMDVPPGRARELATLVIAALEGALVLARADGSTEPLRVVRRQLRRLLG
ncbi:MAG: TetR/AcrR family transcriptional regulator [Dermatophilaceae bacterium]